MREVRKHPAVVTAPADLQPEMEVAIGHLLPTIGKGTRCAQALMGMTFPQGGVNSRREGLMHGFRHTPTWGIVIDDVATVSWVNTSNPVHRHPYASFLVTQTSRDLPLAESLVHIAHSMDEVLGVIEDLPAFETYDEFSNQTNSSLESIIGFEDLGFVPNQFGLDNFVIDLSKLGSNSSSNEQVH